VKTKLSLIERSLKIKENGVFFFAKCSLISGLFLARMIFLLFRLYIHHALLNFNVYNVHNYFDFKRACLKSTMIWPWKPNYSKLDLLWYTGW